MEISAYRSYAGLYFDINFWRTKSGLEVDFVLAKGDVVIEVKGASRVDNTDLKPMQVFIEEYKPSKAIVVCNEKEERIYNGIRIMPWRKFLENLWAGKIL